MKEKNLTAESWSDYELLDSGDNKKLERYGRFFIVRPETQAIWKQLHPEEWKKAMAEFSWEGGRGSWRNKSVPESWKMSWNGVRFIARLTSFKHTGIFPEQSLNWGWLDNHTRQLKSPRVLNLFGYTGIASIVAALAGAKVTHIDASQQANMWAKENAALSGVPEGSIRYLLDDVLKFTAREIRRGNSYEGIVLDPPAFGRGPEGELWRIGESIQPLLKNAAALLSQRAGSFLVLSGYAAGYSPRSFFQSVEGFFPNLKKYDGEFGELGIKEGKSNRIVPSGISLRFVV